MGACSVSHRGTYFRAGGDLRGNAGAGLPRRTTCWYAAGLNELSPLIQCGARRLLQVGRAWRRSGFPVRARCLGRASLAGSLLHSSHWRHSRCLTHQNRWRHPPNRQYLREPHLVWGFSFLYQRRAAVASINVELGSSPNDALLSVCSCRRGAHFMVFMRATKGHRGTANVRESTTDLARLLRCDGVT